MAEVAGRDDEIAAGRTRIFRMNVQVGVKAHCGQARANSPMGGSRLFYAVS
jgi:hypothetical protein